MTVCYRVATKLAVIGRYGTYEVGRWAARTVRQINRLRYYVASAEMAVLIRAEMKADLEAAIRRPSVDLVLALDPHLGFQPARTRVDNRAGAPLAGFAVADIDAFRLAGSDC